MAFFPAASALKPTQKCPRRVKTARVAIETQTAAEIGRAAMPPTAFPRTIATPLVNAILKSVQKPNLNSTSQKHANSLV